MDKDQSATLEPEALASRLSLARNQAGLTQGQTARLMQMHRPTISEIEAGRRRVSAEELTRFAEVYGVSTTWLLRTGEPDSNRDRIELAARELSKLKDDDLDKVLNLLSALRRDEA